VITWKTLSFVGDLTPNLNFLNDLPSLPSRVFVVCPVALPKSAFGGEMISRKRENETLGLRNPATRKRSREDMCGKKQGLFTITLLLLLRFNVSATTPRQDRPHQSSTSNVANTQISATIEQAQKGDPKAQYQLGSFYMTGTNVPRDDIKAVLWLEKSAKQNFADAEFALGYLYEQGKGVRKNYGKALRYYTAAAEQGQTTAENNLGSMYQRGEGVHKDLRRAAEWYRNAASHGEFIAACNLASLYFRGKGFPRDYAQAATWFRVAAERGYPPAQENLAWMYFTGTGVNLDYSEAAKWVRRAAELGYARAQLDLGFLYEKGKGVPVDYVAAYMWYKTAGGEEEHRAASALKILSSVMTKMQIEQGTTAAAQLKISKSVSPSTNRSDSLGISWLPPR